MSNFRLVDHGYPFKKIMHGKKWVGRVYQHADGTFRGAIHRTELSKAATAVDAFSEAVAKHLGFENAAELHDKNRQVRAANRARRARVRSMADRYLRGSTHEERMSALDGIFDDLFGGKN